MNRFKGMATFNAMQERWETPPDDLDEEEATHPANCKCRGCQMAAAEEYYDSKWEREDAEWND